MTTTIQQIEASALAFATAVLTDGEQAANFVESKLAEGEAFVTSAKANPVVAGLADLAMGVVTQNLGAFLAGLNLPASVTADASAIEQAAAALLRDLASATATAPTVTPAAS